MDKDEMKMKMKMIEEMARVLCNRRCGECEYIPRLCGYKSYCTRLYNAGCRIVGEDEKVFNLRELYNMFKFNEELTVKSVLLQVEHDFVEHPVLTIHEILDRIADRYGIDWDEIHKHNI